MRLGKEICFVQLPVLIAFAESVFLEDILNHVKKQKNSKKKICKKYLQRIMEI